MKYFIINIARALWGTYVCLVICFSSADFLSFMGVFTSGFFACFLDLSAFFGLDPCSFSFVLFIVQKVTHQIGNRVCVLRGYR